MTGNPAVTVADNRVEFQWDDRLSEWYFNSAEGLKQGFTLQSAPAGADGHSSLQIEMALSGDLAPQLAQEGQAILFRDAAGRTILRYADLAVYDANGRQLPAHLELMPLPEGGKSQVLPSGRREAERSFAVRIVVDDIAAAYPLTVDPLLSSEVATPPPPTARRMTPSAPPWPSAATPSSSGRLTPLWAAT